MELQPSRQASLSIDAEWLKTPFQVSDSRHQKTKETLVRKSPFNEVAESHRGEFCLFNCEEDEASFQHNRQDLLDSRNGLIP